MSKQNQSAVRYLMIPWEHLPYSIGTLAQHGSWVQDTGTWNASQQFAPILHADQPTGTLAGIVMTKFTGPQRLLIQHISITASQSRWILWLALFNRSYGSYLRSHCGWVASCSQSLDDDDVDDDGAKNGGPTSTYIPTALVYRGDHCSEKLQS